MKRYLNKAEKNQLGVLIHFQAFLENFVSIQKQLNRPSRWYQTSLTFLIKATKEMLDQLDIKEVEVAFKQVKKLHLVLRTTEEALKDIDKMKEADELVPLNNDSFLTICSFALGTCHTCNTVAYSDCPLRDIFMEYDVEPIYEQCDGCQYNLNKLKENAYFNLYESNGVNYRVQPGLILKGFNLVMTAPLPEEYWNCLRILV